VADKRNPKFLPGLNDTVAQPPVSLVEQLRSQLRDQPTGYQGGVPFPSAAAAPLMAAGDVPPKRAVAGPITSVLGNSDKDYDEGFAQGNAAAKKVARDLGSVWNPAEPLSTAFSLLDKSPLVGKLGIERSGEDGERRRATFQFVNEDRNREMEVGPPNPLLEGDPASDEILNTFRRYPQGYWAWACVRTHGDTQTWEPAPKATIDAYLKNPEGRVAEIRFLPKFDDVDYKDGQWSFSYTGKPAYRAGESDSITADDAFELMRLGRTQMTREQRKRISKKFMALAEKAKLQVHKGQQLAYMGDLAVQVAEYDLSTLKVGLDAARAACRAQYADDPETGWFIDADQSTVRILPYDEACTAPIDKVEFIPRFDNLERQGEHLVFFYKSEEVHRRYLDQRAIDIMRAVCQTMPLSELAAMPHIQKMLSGMSDMAGEIEQWLKAEEPEDPIPTWDNIHHDAAGTCILSRKGQPVWSGDATQAFLRMKDITAAVDPRHKDRITKFTRLQIKRLEQARDQREFFAKRLEEAKVAARGYKAWVGQEIKFQRPAHSGLHRLIQAQKDTRVFYSNNAPGYVNDLKSTLTVDKAVPFVIEHNWAAVIDTAKITENSDSVDAPLPFDETVFEFKANNVHIIVYQSEHTSATFAEFGDFWFCAAGVAPDVADQVKAICIMLDAEVAVTEQIRTPEKQNKHRIAHGKVPLRDYHIVSLARRKRSDPNPFLDPDREFTRKRLHLVRSHLRHYPTHTTRIPWHLRGDPDLGYIDKEYRL
jgi:hypothetical protein